MALEDKATRTQVRTEGGPCEDTGRKSPWTSQGGRPRKEPTLLTPQCRASQPTELWEIQFPSCKPPGHGALLWQPQQRNPHRHTAWCQPCILSQVEPQSFWLVAESSQSAHALPMAAQGTSAKAGRGFWVPASCPLFYSFMSRCRLERRNDAIEIIWQQQLPTNDDSDPGFQIKFSGCLPLWIKNGTFTEAKRFSTL